MWSEDKSVRNGARAVLSLIADYLGGQPETLQLIQTKCSVDEFEKDLCDKIKQELSESAEDGTELWMIITRLLRRNIASLGTEALKAWLEIPQDRFRYVKFRKTAGIMMAYITYYCSAEMDKNKAIYDIFAEPYIQQYMSPVAPLKYLDATLNACYYNSPLFEKVAPGQIRPRPNLRGFAKMTADALDFPNEIVNKDNKEATDMMIAHVFCHWDGLFRLLSDPRAFEDYEEDQQRQDIVDLCLILGKQVGWRIRDRDGLLCDAGKHAVIPLLDSH